MDGGDCKTAMATPGLLKLVTKNHAYNPHSQLLKDTIEI